MRTQRRAADLPSGELPYRASAGILLINREGRIWTGRRLPKWAGDRNGFIWQMPQGGINPGEQPEQAALRELEEETGIRSVDVVAEMPRWLSYDLPPELVGVALKGRYRGQQQKWFAMRFWGDDSEIDIGPRNGKKAEFDRWAWRRAADVPNLIVPFKRDVYETVLREFSHHIRPVRLMGMEDHFSVLTSDLP